jgi:hypothetical protein
MAGGVNEMLEFLLRGCQGSFQLGDSGAGGG